MLLSFSIIFITGLFLGFLCKKIHLPALVGMIAAGIIIGPQVLNLIDGSVLEIAPQLRTIALVIILTRSGLSLDIRQLKKAGRPALLMCFLPATLEIIGVTLLAPPIFGVTIAEAALIGAVLAAVSPAVVVPRMIKIMGERYGTDKQIPQIILAGSSADDVYVIVLFTSLCGIVSGGNVSGWDFAQIPLSILLGALIGVIMGVLLEQLFLRVHIRDSIKVIITLSVSFALIALQDVTEHSVRISGLIAVMAVGMTLLYRYPDLSKRLSERYNRLWAAAEPLLFVLVGAAVDLKSVTAFGFPAAALIFGAMAFRMGGVLLSLIRTKLNLKERVFCMLSYTPKATVQAAIGAIPLAMGLGCGALVLSAAVLAILITAPLGALAIDIGYKRLLKKSD